MARIILYSALLFAFVLGATATYDSRYDASYDIDAVLRDDTLREQHYQCYTRTRPCQNDADRYYSEIFPEAAATKCQKCTRKQREIFRKCNQWYVRYEPQRWRSLVEVNLRLFGGHGGGGLLSISLNLF